MNHVELMKKFIDELGKKEFTHRDIINITGTNCPYSIVKYLKNYYNIDYTDEQRKTKTIDVEGNAHYKSVKYRKFKVLGRKEKDVKEPCIWGAS